MEKNKKNMLKTLDNQVEMKYYINIVIITSLERV